MKILSPILVVILLSLSQGCVSYVSRHSWNENERQAGTTTYFSGTTTDVIEIGKGISFPFREDGDWVELAATPFFLIDLPFSAVADVFWIPDDYSYKKKTTYRDKSGKWECLAPSPHTTCLSSHGKQTKHVHLAVRNEPSDSCPP